jgi:hypothetical protein
MLTASLQLIVSPYKDIAYLDEPFPTSYDWRIPEGIAKDRYFLVSCVS